MKQSLAWRLRKATGRKVPNIVLSGDSNGGSVAIGMQDFTGQLMLDHLTAAEAMRMAGALLGMADISEISFTTVKPMPKKRSRRGGVKEKP